MSTSATAVRQNKVTVSDAGPSAKKVSIEIPASVVSEKIKSALETVSVQAAVPGFRKGKVPAWLVEKRFGPSLRKEAKQDLASSALQDAIKEHKLSVLGTPGGGNLDTVEVEDGKAFAFEVEVEVLPEFKLPSLDGIAVKKPTIEVTDAMVADEMTKIGINEGTLEPREVAEPGDYITGHAVMTDEKGTKFYDLNGAVIQKPTKDKSGKGMILGIMVDDFDKQVGSPKAGDSLTVKAKGPEQHEVEGIRNAKLTITFEAERVDRIIPATADDLVKLFGLESEDRLKELLKNRMTQRVQVQQQTAMRQQVAKFLLDNTTMDLPKRMTASQAGRTLERQRMELMYRGTDPQKIEEHMAEMRAASSAVAARDLKLFFILHRAAEELNIGVQENEFNQHVAMMAYQRGVRPEQLRQDLIKTGQANSLFSQIREFKTYDAVIKKATVSDVPAAEYEKLMKDSATA